VKKNVKEEKAIAHKKGFLRQSKVGKGSRKEKRLLLQTNKTFRNTSRAGEEGTKKELSK